MQDPWGVGTGHDATPPQGFFKNALTASKTVPPGNALLAKEQAALARQAAGKNPSVTPGQIAHSLLNAAGINPKAILHNAAVIGSSSLPIQAGVKPHGTVQQAGIPIIGPGGLAHAGALGILPFKRLLGRAAEDVVAKEAPKVAVPEFAKAIHPRAVPKVAGAKTLGESVSEALKPAKGLRVQQEAARSPERFNRQKAYAEAVQANPTAQGAKEAAHLLAGKYPEINWNGFSEFSPEAHDAMVKAVTEYGGLKGGFDVKRATDALQKIRDGRLPAANEEKLLLQVFGPETTKQLVGSVGGFAHIKSLVYDAANIPRSVMASFDASGIMRQALLLGTSHPKIWAKNVPDYIKAIKSEDVYNKGMDALHARPNAVNGVYDRMGVDLTELTPTGERAAAREESFRSPLAEKLTGGQKSPIRMSGRGYTLFLDQARADLADHLYAKALAQGRDVEDPKLLKSIGTVVNSASGRGDLGQGAIGSSAEGLNLLLFSPRLIKSRVDFLNPVWYAKLDPLARHEAYRAIGGLAVLMTTALGIAKAAGAGVNLDPRSSDFAKIKVGNTRIDLAGGFQQYIKILSILASQQTVNSAGKTIDIGQAGAGRTSDFDVLFRFLRSKTAPLVSAGIDVSQRQNAVGQPLTFNNQVVSRLTPLSGQDAVSVGQSTAQSTNNPFLGAIAGIGAFGLSAIGGGVQNYKPKQPKGSGPTDPWNVGGGGPGANPWGVNP